jgi:membrane-associated HD superfamily phosphohydrolase
MTTQAITKPNQSRLFYSGAAIALLVLTFIGFRFFYLHMQAYPGRPLTPPIRTLLIIHGVLMTAWMLLSIVQPLLVAGGKRRIHMMLGIVGTALAAAIVVAGYLVAVNAARVNPPDLKLFGLNQKEFLTVPLSGVVTFGAFVFIGVWNRRRPEVHRPMMLMASLAIVAAAMGRMAALNDWYAGTWLEHWFSAFVSTLILGAVLLAIKCTLERRFDRWFAGAFGSLALICVATSLVAKTDAWVQFATILTR